MSSVFRNPVIVALDVDSADEALRRADELKDLAGGFKLGPRLCLRYGRDLVRQIAHYAPVFVDNKHFDIPSTMAAAVRASYDAGASAVTVHSLAGPEALAEMAQVEKELGAERPFIVLAVTILTSWNEKSYPPALKTEPVSTHVTSLARASREAGLKGLVCSPHEIASLKNQGHFLVTPGIRADIDDKGDQKRVMSAAQAIREGAGALVIGRPVLQAADPRAKVQEILSSIR